MALCLHSRTAFGEEDTSKGKGFREELGVFEDKKLGIAGAPWWRGGRQVEGSAGPPWRKAVDFKLEGEVIRGPQDGEGEISDLHLRNVV